MGKFLYSVQVAVHERDATIQVTHGGIEIGQGVNTKVAQVVAKGLGLPDLSLIRVCAANTFVANNNNWTGGSQVRNSIIILGGVFYALSQSWGLF